MVGRTLQSPSKILGWAVVCYDTNPHAQQNVQRLAEMLVKNLQQLGERSEH